MRIDSTHRPWLVATVVALIAAAILYVWYASSTPGGPRGGTAAGLAFGVVGYGFMLFAGLLGARKKVPVWRIGRAQTWMRGHLWLGLLSLPLILFHGGFAFRGPLTGVLMVLLVVVIASGVAGAALQHYVPGLISAQVPLETIYEEIPHIRRQLREEADELVETAVQVDEEHEDKVRFRELYAQRVRPFLDAPAVGLVEPLRALAPAAFRGVLDDLESICEEQRQLTRQRRLYHLLHVWLLVHVPLSIALLVLGGVHAVMALRY
ncbi:MAG: hypothetical protein ABI811_15980 [Acidobacteriota bacterium]